MADKKSKAADAAHEDIVYAPEAATPVVVAEPSDITKLNTLSVVSIASAVTGFGAVAGIVTGHVALAQLRRSGEKGRGLALAGLITGYVGIAGFALMSALAVGNHWGQNGGEDNRGYMGDSQHFGNRGGQFGGMFGDRGQDDGGFGMMGGNGQIQGGAGQGGSVQVGPGQGGITLDSNGNSTITLPNGQTITIPDGAGNGMPGLGGKGMGGNQPQPVPLPSGVQGN